MHLDGPRPAQQEMPNLSNTSMLSCCSGLRTLHGQWSETGAASRLGVKLTRQNYNGSLSENDPTAA